MGRLQECTSEHGGILSGVETGGSCVVRERGRAGMRVDGATCRWMLWREWKRVKGGWVRQGKSVGISKEEKNCRWWFGL